MKNIEVVAALIERDNKVLCVQRGFSKYRYLENKWEFPGGKIENNETEHEALIREIKEELDMEIRIINKIITTNHSYPDFTLIMHVFQCTSNDKPKLFEHKEYRWLYKNELVHLDWAAADIPVVYKYLETC